MWFYYLHEKTNSFSSPNCTMKSTIHTFVFRNIWEGRIHKRVRIHALLKWTRQDAQIRGYRPLFRSQRFFPRNFHLVPIISVPGTPRMTRWSLLKQICHPELSSITDTLKVSFDSLLYLTRFLFLCKQSASRSTSVDGAGSKRTTPGRHILITLARRFLARLAESRRTLIWCSHTACEV